MTYIFLIFSITFLLLAIFLKIYYKDIINRKNKPSYIYFKADIITLKITKPIWWDTVTLKEEITNVNYKELYKKTTPNRWEEYVKTSLYCLKFKNELPIILAGLAHSNGDYQLSMDIHLEMELYFEKKGITSDELFTNNFNLTQLYVNLGDCFLETHNLKKARYYYNKARYCSNHDQEILDFAVNDAGNKLIFLNSIKNEELYIFQQRAFRDELIKIYDTYNKSTQLVEKQRTNLNNTLAYVNTDKISIFELAFINLINNNLKSKILIPETKNEIKELLAEHHENKELYFPIKPVHIQFPSISCDKWTLEFAGLDDELVLVHFNKWNVEEFEVFS